jgi:hypothetical protein
VDVFGPLTKKQTRFFLLALLRFFRELIYLVLVEDQKVLDGQGEGLDDLPGSRCFVRRHKFVELT